jgi:hypothetical protein
VFEKTMLMGGSRRWFRLPAIRLAIKGALRKSQIDCAFSLTCGNDIARAKNAREGLAGQSSTTAARPASVISYRTAPDCLVNIRVRSSRSGLSGINRPCVYRKFDSA